MMVYAMAVRIVVAGIMVNQYSDGSGSYLLGSEDSRQWV